MSRHRLPSFRRLLPLAGFVLAESGMVIGAMPSGLAQDATVVDLPLAPGLRVSQDAGFSFDKPTGRIVEVVAVGDADVDRVRAFYAATAPQLGWEPVGRDRYAREGEILTVEYLGVMDQDLVVRFTLAPQ